MKKEIKEMISKVPVGTLEADVRHLESIIAGYANEVYHLQPEDPIKYLTFIMHAAEEAIFMLKRIQKESK